MRMDFAVSDGVDMLAPLDGGRPELLHRAALIGRQYQNPVPTQLGGLAMAFRVLPRYLASTAERVPRRPLGPFHTDPALFDTPSLTGLRVTWMGHSSMLLEIDGMRVLIDPVWEERASPFKRFGPKRFFPPTLALEQLPPLDVVLVSHNHYDHLGARTLERLTQLPQTKKTRWVTSLGIGAQLRHLGVSPERLHELDWTEGVRVRAVDSDDASRWLEVRAWPARHFSGRGIRDRFHTLWSSFSLHGPVHSVYFGADSGPWEGFRSIARAVGAFDLVMLEIGAYDELWADIHLGPDRAVEALQQITAGAGRPALFMPIHWGLFDLALHAWDQPIERTVELSGTAGIDLWTPVPGQPTECVRGEGKLDPWWRRGRS